MSQIEIVLVALQVSLLVLVAIIVVKQHKFTVTIELLEKNTNSIKDALVKTTGEAEFARGVQQENDRWQKNWKPKSVLTHHGR